MLSSPVVAKAWLTLPSKQWRSAGPRRPNPLNLPPGSISMPRSGDDPALHGRSWHSGILAHRVLEDRESRCSGTAGGRCYALGGSPFLGGRGVSSSSFVVLVGLSPSVVFPFRRRRDGRAGDAVGVEMIPEVSEISSLAG